MNINPRNVKNARNTILEVVNFLYGQHCISSVFVYTI